MISAEGAGVGITPVAMEIVSESKDEWPMRVHAPVFTVKNIGQTSPYPGVLNTITVTVTSNFNMVNGTRIVMHGFEGAVMLDGDVKLLGANATSFVSLGGVESHGTWVGCDNALVLVVNKELGCGHSSFVLSFVVTNPVQAQDCMDIRINATVPSTCNIPKGSFKVTQQRIAPGISNAIGSWENDSYPEAYLALSENGFDMNHDLTTELHLYGAMMGDACPLLIWPAAFLTKDITQSSPYPCAKNTISITFRTNVPLLSSSKEDVSVTISEIYMAQPWKATDSSIIESLRCNGISCVDNRSSEIGSIRSWSTNNKTNMSSMTLYPGNGIAYNKSHVVTFTVINPDSPQAATKTVSISSSGLIKIFASPMHHVFPLNPTFC